MNNLLAILGTVDVQILKSSDDQLKIRAGLPPFLSASKYPAGTGTAVTRLLLLRLASAFTIAGQPPALPWPNVEFTFRVPLLALSKRLRKL